MNNPNVAQISFNNSTSATVRGLEIEVRKSFSFIPLKFFRDLSLVGNYSLMESEALLQFLYEGENLNQKRQLQGQAPYSLNLGLFYDNAGTGTKIALLYNEVGPRIYAASLGHRAHFISDYNVYDEGDLGSLIELTSHQLDIAISQRIVKSLQLKFSVQNLLNQPVRMAEDANFTYKYEKAKCISGITLEGDMIANEYYPGRYFTLSISYSF
jgi:outer membrane receptor protein involved in Fe transport